VLVPGDEAADLSIALADASGAGTSFDVRVEAGVVTDVPVDGLADGRYTATVRSSVPVVAGARTSTATEGGQVDVAWTPSAPALAGDTQVTVSGGRGPALTLANPGEEIVTATVVRGDGEEAVEVAPGGSADVAVEPGETVTLRGAEGLRAAVAYASPGRIAAWSVASPLPASTPVVVHP